MDTSVDAKGRKLLTATSIKQLQSSILQCVDASNGDIEFLKRTVSNVPSHVFGNHQNCDPQVCNVVGDTSLNKMDILWKTGLIYHINGDEFLIAFVLIN